MKKIVQILAVVMFVGCGVEAPGEIGGTNSVSETEIAGCNPKPTWLRWGQCENDSEWHQVLWEGHFGNDCNPNPSPVLGKLPPTITSTGATNAACVPPVGNYPALCYISTLPEGSGQCTVSVSADGTVTLTSHTPIAFTMVYPDFRL